MHLTILLLIKALILPLLAMPLHQFKQWDTIEGSGSHPDKLEVNRIAETNEPDDLIAIDYIGFIIYTELDLSIEPQENTRKKPVAFSSHETSMVPSSVEDVSESEGNRDEESLQTTTEEFAFKHSSRRFMSLDDTEETIKLSKRNAPNHSLNQFSVQSKTGEESKEMQKPDESAQPVGMSCQLQLLCSPSSKESAESNDSSDSKGSSGSDQVEDSLTGEESGGSSESKGDSESKEGGESEGGSGSGESTESGEKGEGEGSSESAGSGESTGSSGSGESEEGTGSAGSGESGEGAGSSGSEGSGEDAGNSGSGESGENTGSSGSGESGGSGESEGSSGSGGSENPSENGESAGSSGESTEGSSDSGESESTEGGIGTDTKGDSGSSVIANGDFLPEGIVEHNGQLIPEGLLGHKIKMKRDVEIERRKDRTTSTKSVFHAGGGSKTFLADDSLGHAMQSIRSFGFQKASFNVLLPIRIKLQKVEHSVQKQDFQNQGKETTIPIFYSVYDYNNNKDNQVIRKSIVLRSEVDNSNVNDAERLWESEFNIKTLIRTVDLKFSTLREEKR